MAPLQSLNISAPGASVITNKVRKPFPLLSFRPTVAVRPTIHIKDYSDEEISEVWYTKAEKDTIKSEIRRTLLRMLDGSTEADTDQNHCIRGLETYTPAGQTLKRKRRKEAISLVLEEQESQTEKGTPDPELLADLYYEETHFSRASARIMGLADEETVRNLTLILPLSKTPLKSLSRSDIVGRRSEEHTSELPVTSRSRMPSSA